MNLAFIQLVGASALLIYSMQSLSDCIQYLAGSRFRIWINQFVASDFASFGLGLLLSVLLSSSGAVTVLLVGLANARMLNLHQILFVTLGAAVGTTVIVQIIAFKVSQYALLAVAAGVTMQFMARSERKQKVAQGVLFLGLMFFSMQLLMDAGVGLESNELFQYLLNYFRDRPLFCLFLATVLTAMVHSSAATIAFVMSLMVAQNGTIYEAIPWVLGANLGTTATAFMASQSGGDLGRQVAIAHFLVKFFGVTLCYFFMPILGDLSIGLADDLARQIAHSHTLFNLIIALLFFPFVNYGVRLVEYLVPKKEKEGPFQFHYLNEQALESPELALAQAQREILRMSDLVEKMVQQCIGLFERFDEEKFEALKQMDQVCDFINKGVKLFLTKLSRKNMTEEQTRREFALLLRTNDLESIGDMVDRHILPQVKKHSKKGYSFSGEGWSELLAFHQLVLECLRVSNAYFTSKDRVLGTKLMLLDERVEAMNIDLTERHLKRLHQGVKESIDTTSIHLDLLGNLERISHLSINFAVHQRRDQDQEIT